MNTYQISVDIEADLLKQWLLKNECPKAAKTIKAGKGFTSQYTVEGNVSALSALDVFEQMGVRHECKPVGNSQPLDSIIKINVFTF